LETRVDLDYMNQPFDAKQPLRIGAGLGAENRFRGQIAEVRVYRMALDPQETAVLAVAEPVNRLVEIPQSQRSAAQAAKLQWCFLERYAPDPIKAARKSVLDLREQRNKLADSFPTVMVMQDSATPRETHIQVRGAYDRPGEKVDPGVPAVLGGPLPPVPSGVPNNRLALAR